MSLTNKAAQVPTQTLKNRSELFGLEGFDNRQYYKESKKSVPPPPPCPAPQSQALGGATYQQQNQWTSTAAPGGVYASHAAPMAAPRAMESARAKSGGLRFGSLRKSEAESVVADQYSVAADYADGRGGGGRADFDFDNETLASVDPELQFEESSFEESGMTTTYDLPSLKTLAPTSTVSKHKIARIEFKNVVFSHIIIPKLKAAAFLKARLRNASKITLLKGSAGLTLDGSFLGQSNIPRCSAGDAFSLPLGVDPTINVAYAKPTVRRSQSGIFSKEDCEVFTRTATITNTKSNAAVEMTVLDQVPVSEDERLRIEIIKPVGLRIGGATVADGVGTTPDTAMTLSKTPTAASNARASVYGEDASSREAGKWGSATVAAKKGGEVKWLVKINPSRGCKLVLEYEASYPGGESVVAADK